MSFFEELKKSAENTSGKVIGIWSIVKKKVLNLQWPPNHPFLLPELQ